MKMYSLIIALLSVASTTANADPDYFEVVNQDLSRDLIFALTQYAERHQAGVEISNGELIVKDEQGETAIVCAPAEHNTCRFSSSLKPSRESRRLVSKVVFESLLLAFENRNLSDQVLQIAVHGNKHRTFATLQSTYQPFWKLAHGIECNATPKRGSAGFDYATCEFNISRSTSGETAEALYQQVLTSSDLSGRLALLEQDSRLVRQSVSVVSQISWLNYGWQELHVKFSAAPNAPRTSGELAGVDIKIFVNGVVNGKVLIEKSQEYLDRFVEIGPR